MKANKEKISMLTAYDFTMARILDNAGIDVILVGDSASNVMAGHETTLPITLDQMIYHAQAVVRGVNRSLVVVDLPFGTYQGNSKARAFIGGQGDAKDSCSSISTKDNRTDTTGYARYYLYVLYVPADNRQGGDVCP